MDYYKQMDLYAKKRNARLVEQSKHRTPSQRRSYDPTLHLAQEMISTAHGGNQIEVQLIKNIDNGSKHYGDKTLLGYTKPNSSRRHALVMELPLDDAQYNIIRMNAKNW